MLTFREWIRKIETRASGPGGGNSILRSIRPGRKSAESRISVYNMSEPRASSESTKYGTRTNAIGGHNNLDILRCLESIQLVQQL